MPESCGDSNYFTITGKFLLTINYKLQNYAQTFFMRAGHEKSLFSFIPNSRRFQKDSPEAFKYG